MKCISLWQPWASLIACGAKPYETRDWKPPRSLIGQRIAVHAAKKPVGPILRTMDDDTLEEITAALSSAGMLTGHLPIGAILCTAVLAEAVQVNSQGWFLVGNELIEAEPDLFGNYSPGRWIWRLEDVVRLDVPVPAKGAQGFFDVEVAA